MQVVELTGLGAVKRFQLKLVNIAEETSYPGPSYSDLGEALGDMHRRNLGRKVAENVDRYFVHDLVDNELFGWVFEEASECSAA
jgi:hypothetical protein